MERRDNREDQDDDLLSCWGRLKLIKLKLKMMKLPWERRRSTIDATRQRRRVDCKVTNPFKLSKRPLRPPGAGFRYDPISYSQNFDEGWEEDEEDYTYRAFSSRYAAAPPLKPFTQSAFSSSGSEAAAASCSSSIL